MMSKGKYPEFDRGVAYALHVAETLASPDDWGVPSVYVSILRDELGLGDKFDGPGEATCPECEYPFTRTIVYYEKCADCTRRAYK